MLKEINLPGIKIELSDDNNAYVDYYMKKAKTLNGFFQINRMKEDHEDLQIIAMYLAIQMALGIISRDDMEVIKEEIFKIEEALRPRFSNA